MKKVVISSAIQNVTEVRGGVERATQVLEETIGPTARHVDADWSLTQDSSGRRLIKLLLSDFTGARTESRFEPAEFHRPGHLPAKLYKIWGDLLQVRSHKQLEVLSGSIEGGR